MAAPEADQRSPTLREQDEKTAAEPKLPAPELPCDAKSSPVEIHLARRKRRPFALEGVVENGVIRLLDSSIKIPEHSRVIIVTTETV